MLNQAVRAMREQLRLTQLELATRLYCSPQAVSDYETGNRRVPDGYLKAVAVLFSVNEPDDPQPTNVLDLRCEACEIHAGRSAIVSLSRNRIRHAA